MNEQSHENPNRILSFEEWQAQQESQTQAARDIHEGLAVTPNDEAFGDAIVLTSEERHQMRAELDARDNAGAKRRAFGKIAATGTGVTKPADQ